jgi:DNA-binding NtrC family response regulator
MIKRVVILQDEQLVVREIQRNMERVAAMPAMAGAGAPLAMAAVAGGMRGLLPTGPSGFPAGPEPENEEVGEEREAPEEGGGSLASVAKAASMKAERAAIEHTLRQVHWNRRKAAQILGVSYKTLLNKIKECGISRV